MKPPVTSPLYDQRQSLEFYENRYEQGYMDEWPFEKKRRVLEILTRLELPFRGVALDFGCGNGVLTEIVRTALPGWKVYGTDISKTALANAKMRYPGCIFVAEADLLAIGEKFDFVFTHHVFEHVFDLGEVFGQMNACLKAESSMLHFLPCGNEGSYEHNICALRKDGMNPLMGNRFFFEDEGHVRRLTTEEFCQLCKIGGFELEKEFYSNQYYGAIDWITRSSPKFVLRFTENSQVASGEGKRTLNQERIKLLAMTFLRAPMRVAEKMSAKRQKSLRHYGLLCLALPFCALSAPIHSYLKMMSRREWDERKSDRRGSEMCLYFRRSVRNAPPPD